MAIERVLILCTANSARSQMAEGLLRHAAPDRVLARSAGTQPGGVRAEAIQVMREIGIDITSHWSKHVDDFRAEPFDVVITVCDHANETCPIFPGAPERIHWSVPDPAAEPGDEAARLEAFRRVRDDLQARIAHFAASRSAIGPD